MTALLADDVILGAQRPRLMSLPPSHSLELGYEAVELATDAGLILDDWQAWCLVQSMATQANGLWAAMEVCWIVPRQNGKNAILLARELFGMFVIGEPLTIHTAHKFDASGEHFIKMQTLIAGYPAFSKRVAKVSTANGKEGMALKPKPTLIFGPGATLVRQSVAPRLKIMARSKGSGRAFTCDCLVYDEGMILSDAEVGASMPTLRAVPNPQVWYTASAGMPDSTQLSEVRNRGIAGTDPSLVYGEWSCDPHTKYCPPHCTKHDDRDDPRSWAKSNPGFGRRITHAQTAKELTKMPRREFDREILGIGDWPVGEAAWLVIPERVWDECQVPLDTARPARIAVAVDVAPDQSAACISIATITKDASGNERVLVEIGVDPQGMPDHRAGTQWVVPRLKELKLRHRLAAIVIDQIGPGAVVTTDAEKAGLEVTKPTLRDVAAAHLQFCNWARDIPAEGDKPAQPRKLAHLGQRDLRSAVASGVRREVGDGQFAWSRKAATVDITPVCAATFAAWAADKFGRGYDILKSIA